MIIWVEDIDADDLPGFDSLFVRPISCSEAEVSPEG